MGASLFGGGTGKTSSTGFNNSDTTGQSSTVSNTATGTNASTVANQSAVSNTAQYGSTANNTNQQQYGSSGVAGWQMPYINAGLDTALQQLMRGFNTSAPSMSYTSLSPEQRQAMDALSQYASGISAPNMDAMRQYGMNLTGALGDARSSLGGILSQTMSDPTQGNIDAASRYADNPYVQGMIQQAQTPIERQLKEVSVPGLNINANRGGNMDSSRAAMTEAILRGRAGVDMSNVASGILGDNYRSGLSLAEQARMGNLSAGLNATGQMYNIGRAGSDMAFQGNDAALRAMGIPVQVGQMAQDDANRANAVNFQNQQLASQYPWDQIANYWNIAGKPLGTETTGLLSGYNTGTTAQSGEEAKYGTNAQYGTSSTLANGTQNQSATSHTNGITTANGTQTQPGPGILGGTLGALSGIGSLFSSGGIFGAGSSLLPLLGLSDRRLKTDVQTIGQLPNGLSVYSFRYIWSDEPKIGLMADEVEQVHPEAVVEGPMGFKMVDYAKAMQ